MNEALRNAKEELYCWNCGGVHPGECANRIHCQKNDEYSKLFHESEWGMRWIAAGSPKLIKGHMLIKGEGKPWTIVRVDEVSENFENSETDANDKIETINISALYDSAKQAENLRK